MNAEWPELVKDAYICVKYNAAGQAAKKKAETRGYFISEDGGRQGLNLYFAKFGRIRVEFLILRAHIDSIVVIPDHKPPITGGGGRTSKAIITTIMALQEAYDAKLADLHTRVDGISGADACNAITNIVEGGSSMRAHVDSLSDVATKGIERLSADVNRRLNAATTQLRGIVDTISTRLDTHERNIKIIVAEIKQMATKVATLEKAADANARKVMQVVDWINKK